MGAKLPTIGSFPIPFVVGVTGHRSITPGTAPILEKSVGEVLAELPKPLLLLTGLAAGADQLAARIAIQQGVHVGAVLPMPPGLYRATMDQPGRDGFDELISQASVVIELPLADGVTIVGLEKSEEQRARQYQALGRFLVQHCQAAIALWDGMKTAGAGGTAHVVEMFRSAGAAVFHILTPRGNETGAGKIERSVSSHPAIAERLLALNQVIDNAPPNGGLLPPGLAIHLPEFEQRVAQAFWAADEAAIRFSRSTRSTFGWLLALAFVAVASFEVYAHLFPENHFLWFIYPAALAVAWSINRMARKKDVESLYLEHRSLAEALRTQFFWSLAGIDRSAADAYLEHQCDWVRSVLRTLWLYCGHNGHRVSDGFELSLEYWVKHQAAWFKEKAAEQREAQERVEKLSDWLLKALFVFSIAAPTWLMFQHEVAPATHGLLILLVTLPSLLVALHKLWIEKQGYEEQARAYHRLGDLFRQHSTLNRDQLEQLGLEVLRENSDWLLLHRERPLHVVAGA